MVSSNKKRRKLLTHQIWSESVKNWKITGFNCQITNFWGHVYMSPSLYVRLYISPSIYVPVSLCPRLYMSPSGSVCFRRHSTVWQWHADCVRLRASPVPVTTGAVRWHLWAREGPCTLRPFLQWAPAFSSFCVGIETALKCVGLADQQSLERPSQVSSI